MSEEWTTSDAWVLSALAGTNREKTRNLEELIGIADAICHAMIGEGEFVGAVRHLLAAGLIGADAASDQYWQSESGAALYERRMKRQGLFGWTDVVLPALRKLGPPQESEWSLPAAVFRQATRRYLRGGQMGQVRLMP